MENKSIDMPKIAFLTYGCTFNKGDSLKIKHILESKGCKFDSIENSDIIIINTCAVKHSTESKTIFLIKKITGQYKNKKIIITGCLPQIDEKIFDKIKKMVEPMGGSIIHPSNIEKYVEILQGKSFFEFKMNGNNFHCKKSQAFPYSTQMKHSIIQISEGCNNCCTYCCTTIARGNLRSFKKDDIIQQIKKLNERGIIEFYLTSQDLGNYNYNSYNLTDLLREISNLPGNFRIRLGMVNPDFLHKHIHDLIPIFNDKRFYRFLHLPIQSASNNVLEKMKRQYKIDMVNEVIKELIKFDKNFTIATDVIAGFPMETEEDFKKTIEWLEKFRPHVVNISKFSSRPNTQAKKMPQLNSKIIKQRSLNLTKIYNDYISEENKKWIGWEGPVLINEFKRNKEYQYTGRNLYYVPILCKNGNLWKEKKVVVKDYINHSLIGESL